MSLVKMYTTAVCPYCVRAKQLLKSRGVEHVVEVRVDLDEGIEPLAQAPLEAGPIGAAEPRLLRPAQHVDGAQRRLEGLGHVRRSVRASVVHHQDRGLRSVAPDGPVNVILSIHGLCTSRSRHIDAES